VDVVISEHARFEMVRRQISEEVVIGAIQHPQQIVELGKRRIVCQNKYYDSIEGEEMLLRVICEKSHDMSFVVTSYKTSKVEKYWKEGD